MNIDKIKEMMDGLDISALLPDIPNMMDKVALLARILLMVGPMVLLFLGLHYFLAAPKEANFSTGFRCRWSMSSVEAWQFTQKLAGCVWILLGLGLGIAMAILGGKLAELEMMDRLLKTAGYVALQVVPVLVGNLAIRIAVFARFDAKGRRRLTWRELFGG